MGLYQWDRKIISFWDATIYRSHLNLNSIKMCLAYYCGRMLTSKLSKISTALMANNLLGLMKTCALIDTVKGLSLLFDSLGFVFLNIVMECCFSTIIEV